MINAVGRDIPEELLKKMDRPAFGGAFAWPGREARAAVPPRAINPGGRKLLRNLAEAIECSGLGDGMTISFHHHLRNGDQLIRQVLEAVDNAGIRNLTLAASGLFECHAFVEEYIRRGVVAGLQANYIGGPLAQAVSAGGLAEPVIMRSHGGRDRALESGDLAVDVAFIAAPSADPCGNLNAVEGPSAFGAFGYAAVDARYARCSVAVTDHLKPYPLAYVAIDQTLIDYVVVVDFLGDPRKIVSGSTRITNDPVGRRVARLAAEAVEYSGLFQPGFSLQTGAGGISLAAASYIGERMRAGGLQGSFGLGGITETMVSMLRDGLFQTLLDVQCFDLEAVKSLRENPNHREITCSTYSNPHTKGAVVNYLDAVILGATEIDLDFNVNVTTGSDGAIMGGSGGHADTAAGSKLAVIVSTLTRTRLPVVVERVETINTPGETVDVLVTDRGLAVNPRRPDLADRFKAAGLPLRDIRELQAMAENLCGRPSPLRYGERIVAVIEYRDGTIIDTVRQVE